MISRLSSVHDVTMAGLHAASVPPDQAWRSDDFATILGGPGVVGWLHQKGGFLLARQVTDEAEVIAFAVVPAVRRQGVGRALLGHALERLASQGVRLVYLEVAITNTAAVGLYRGFAFATVGRRAAYYPDGGEAMVMRLCLGGAVTDTTRRVIDGSRASGPGDA